MLGKMHQMPEDNLRTQFINPPIPIRYFDWVAWLDGKEESGNYGYGRTEEEAIIDLHNQIGELENGA